MHHPSCELFRAMGPYPYDVPSWRDVSLDRLDPEWRQRSHVVAERLATAPPGDGTQRSVRAPTSLMGRNAVGARGALAASAFSANGVQHQARARRCRLGIYAACADRVSISTCAPSTSATRAAVPAGSSSTPVAAFTRGEMRF